MQGINGSKRSMLVPLRTPQALDVRAFGVY
jgi:hypothetical protein